MSSIASSSILSSYLDSKLAVFWAEKSGSNALERQKSRLKKFFYALFNGKSRVNFTNFLVKIGT